MSVMKKVFKQTALILMRELSWRCFGHKIDWRRLFLLAAVFTVSGFVFQMLVHSNVIVLFHYPNETDSSLYKSSNSTIQGARLQQVHLSLSNSVVPSNSSNTFVQSVSVEKHSVETPARRKSSVSGNNRKDGDLAGTTKLAISLSPPRSRVPSGKQVDVAEILNLFLSFLIMLSPVICWICMFQRHVSLLLPADALVYAKKEIDHAPLVNEDPNFYAPVFRNISVFRRYLDFYS